VIFKRRISAVCAVLVGVALPAYANNPPRADGVLYLILVFPMIAIVGHLAGVETEKGGWAGRIGRGAFFTFVILASAAGTDIGLLAMLVIVVYGLVRSSRIATRGKGESRILWAAVAVGGTLLAGAGYIWAIASTSAPAISRSRQARTMSDMRSVATAIMSWSVDNAEGEAGELALEAESGDEDQTSVEASESGSQPPADGEQVVFSEALGPPLISPAELGGFLVPDYIAEVPELDGWRQPMEYRFDPVSHRFQIRSGGADHRFDGDSYSTGPFDRTDFDRDIVYADGVFVTWPRSIGEE